MIPIVDVIYEHRAYLPERRDASRRWRRCSGMLLQRVAPEGTERVTVLCRPGAGPGPRLGDPAAQRRLGERGDALERRRRRSRPGRPALTSSSEKSLESGREDGRGRAGVPPGPRRSTRGPSPRGPAFATFLQRSGRTVRSRERSTARRCGSTPTHHPAIFNLAEILWRSGRRDEGGELYRRFLELAPPSRTGRGARSPPRVPARGATGSRGGASLSCKVFPGRTRLHVGEKFSTAPPAVHVSDFARDLRGTTPRRGRARDLHEIPEGPSMTRTGHPEASRSSRRWW